MTGKPERSQQHKTIMEEYQRSYIGPPYPGIGVRGDPQTWKIRIFEVFGVFEFFSGGFGPQNWFQDVPEASAIVSGLINAQNGGMASILDRFLCFWTNFGPKPGPNRAQAGPGPGRTRAWAGPDPGPGRARPGPKPGPSRPKPAPGCL